MVGTSNLLRRQVAGFLFFLYTLLLIVSILVNYAVPKRTLEIELKKSFEGDAKAIAEQFESYFKFVNDMLLSFSLNREVSRILTLTQEDAKSEDNIASYEIIISSLKYAAQRLGGELYLHVKDTYLFANNKGEIGNAKYDELAMLEKVASLEADIPLIVYSDKDKLVFEMPVLNFMTFSKIGEIYLVVKKTSILQNILKTYEHYQFVVKNKNGEVLISKGKVRKNQLIYSQNVVGNNFNLTVSGAKDYIYRQISFIRWLFLILTFISMLFIIVLSLLISNVVVNPLKSLEQLFKKIKQKDLSVERKISQINDEIDKIYDSFFKILQFIKRPIMYFNEIAYNPNISKSKFESIIQQSEDINKEINEKSIKFLNSLERQKDCLKVLSESMDMYMHNLKDIKVYLMNQCNRLKTLNSLCSSFKLEIGKVENYTEKIKEILFHYNNIVSDLSNKIKELIKLVNNSGRLARGLKIVQISVKVELINNKIANFIDISALETLISGIEQLITRFYDVLKNIDDMNQDVIKEIWNLHCDLKRDQGLQEQFLSILNKMESNILGVYQKINDVVNEIDTLKSKIEEINNEIDIDIAKLNNTKNNVQQVLTDCFSIKENIENMINEIGKVEQLSKEIKEYVSAYKL
ncbi:methyl-accepting chemotaxis protein [Anaerocellum danielii]|uniref:Methyl-accepting chemotaxis protein n=1 Tax=Anaerocellum danielii TaxID=1387557 RepID=A0ABZ0U0Z3_9FIRM|nr:methyl-accepting chemotaxis protein [Caldicellulosiruptor danielii]WPX09387.1 methyl-accepting chemotaxis protein [Caldicellulosiruptor danielii]